MAKSAEISLLFLSAGRRVELLRAFRRAFETLSVTGRIVATDVDPLAPALQVADASYMVPRYDEPAYVDGVCHLCRREGIDAVFTLIDFDIPLLARHQASIEATGARLMVVPLAAAERTADKWLTAAFFADLGLPTPRTWLPNEIDGARMRYPVFIKPRRGSAGKNAFAIRSVEELNFFVNYVPEPMIQEFLPGPEITTDVVTDLDGQVLGLVSRQRLEVRSGEVAKGVTVRDEAVTRGCVQIARALPARGPITVQCMMKDGTPHFTEINPRFGGGIPLGIAAGVDAPTLLVASLLGREVDRPEIGRYRIGLYMTRFDDSFFLSEQDRDALASRRL